MGHMKTCTKCGVEKPLEKFSPDRRNHDGRQSYCKTCYQIESAIWRAANSEKRRAYQAAWYLANCDTVKARVAIYRVKNLEKVRAYAMIYRQENRDKYRVWNKTYYVTHQEKELVRGATYRKMNAKKIQARSAAYRRTPKAKEIACRNSRTRRARERNCEISLTAEEWGQIIVSYNGRCAYCGMKLRVGGPRTGNKLTQDHIRPLSKGGVHSADNVVPACWTCNSEKRAKKPGNIGMTLQMPLPMGALE